ncbi:MAG: hypothetical protein QXS96_07645 [Candidatus Caldarchaeum sp.]
MTEFLVTIHTDKKLLKHLLTPKIVVDAYGYSIIPVEIRCDHCEERIGVNGQPAGYALFDAEKLWEVLCENCKQRFHPNKPVYSSITEALKHET